MKIYGSVSVIGKDTYKVRNQTFTCKESVNVGFTKVLKRLSVEKRRLEVWIRDEDSVLLGIKIK